MAAAHLQRVAPVLRVSSRSFPKMKDFFVDKLGFSVGTALPHFATLDRDGLTVILDCKPIIALWRRNWAVYFWVDDIDAYFVEATQRGAKIKGGVIDKPYGCREFVVIAPDNREIVFGQLK